ncbi:hypothetical protein ACFOGJ_22265 [Marinibaculum pumilum]|uniref:Uncharacterized protein n=1 Tax=Marinibaculum pumilum TaxID=1766165 RepID=A0ABV7L5T8_9PROT
MDWWLFLLVPVALLVPVLVRRQARRVENREPDESPTGYVIEVANHAGRPIFVDCVDGRTRQGRDIAPGQSAIVLDSRRFGPVFRPTWRVKLHLLRNREEGGPVYPGHYGQALDLEIARRTTPGTQQVRIALRPDGPEVDGPALRRQAAR